MKKILGITGGIGTGKSTVMQILREDWGAELCFADEIARDLTRPGQEAWRLEIELFGPSILKDDGTIDRRRLSALVFSDPAKLAAVNGIVHPLVAEEVRRRIAAAEGLFAYEAALPGEAGFRALCDEIWVVRAPLEVRIDRLMAGRGLTREQCLAAIRNQLSESEFDAMADRIVENGESLEETRDQIRQFLTE